MFVARLDVRKDDDNARNATRVSSYSMSSERPIQEQGFFFLYICVFHTYTYVVLLFVQMRSARDLNVNDLYKKKGRE